MRLLLLPFALLLVAAGGHEPFRVLDINPKGGISAVAFEDLDGDGRQEVLLSHGSKLTVYRMNARGVYDVSHPVVLAVPPHAVFFGAGPADGDRKRREILYLSPAGVLVQSLPRSGPPPPVKLLVSTKSLVPPGSRDALHPGSFFRDLDGDGLPDLALPSARGFEIFYQRPRSKTGGKAANTPPAWPGKPDRILPYRLPSRIVAEAPGLSGRLISTVEVPDLLCVDFNGDGKKDLVVDDGRTLAVYAAKKDGRIGAAPAQTIDLMPLAKRGGSVPEFELADVNGDGRPDFVVSRPDRARVEVHLAGRPLSGPGIRLPAPGSPLPPRIVDLNGDGRPDILVPHTPDFSLPTAVSVTFSGAITMDASIFLNTGKPKTPFRTKPDAVREIRVKIRLFVDETGRIRAARSLLMVVKADFDGDGRKDLLLREGTDEVELFRGTAKGVFSEDAAATIPIPDTKDCADLETTVRDLNGDGRPDVAVFYRGNSRKQDRLVLLLSRSSKRTK